MTFQDQSESFLGYFKLHVGEGLQAAHHSGQTESRVWDLLAGSDPVTWSYS